MVTSRVVASSIRNRLLATAAGGLLACVVALPAHAFWSRENLEPFNPHENAPSRYAPGAVGYGGPGGNAVPGDCYWSREEVPVGGRLAWRPLRMCNYLE